MLSELFPEDVAAAWGDPLLPSKPLFPEEAALVASAVEKRKKEFAKGRECARSALATLGFFDVPLLTGESREPLWPGKVVGSITHTRGLCAAAVARAERYRGIGIDAEPAEPLEPGVVRRVCRDREAASLPSGALDESLVPRLVFCVKEAVYKCQFPLSRTFLGFEDVTVELDEGTFRASLGVPVPTFRAGAVFAGRWRRTASHLVTATWLDHEA